MYITITSKSFGSLDGSIFIDEMQTKRLSWTDTEIKIMLVHPLETGSYALKIVKNLFDAGYREYPNSFTYVLPELYLNQIITTHKSSQVTLTGKYFANESFKIYLQSKTTTWSKYLMTRGLSCLRTKATL